MGRMKHQQPNALRVWLQFIVSLIQLALSSQAVFTSSGTACSWGRNSNKSLLEETTHQNIPCGFPSAFPVFLAVLSPARPSSGEARAGLVLCPALCRPQLTQGRVSSQTRWLFQPIRSGKSGEQKHGCVGRGGSPPRPGSKQRPSLRC